MKIWGGRTRFLSSEISSGSSLSKEDVTFQNLRNPELFLPSETGRPGWVIREGGKQEAPTQPRFSDGYQLLRPINQRPAELNDCQDLAAIPSSGMVRQRCVYY